MFEDSDWDLDVDSGADHLSKTNNSASHTTNKAPRPLANLLDSDSDDDDAFINALMEQSRNVEVSRTRNDRTDCEPVLKIPRMDPSIHDSKPIHQPKSKVHFNPTIQEGIEAFNSPIHLLQSSVQSNPITRRHPKAASTPIHQPPSSVQSNPTIRGSNGTSNPQVHRQQPPRKLIPTESESKSRKKGRFPGPAGSVLGQVGGQMKKIRQVVPKSPPRPPPSTQTQQQDFVGELIHQNPVWRRLVVTEEVAQTSDSPSLLLTYNIAWAKEKLRSVDFSFKIPTLAVAIKSIDLTTGLDPSCELLDTSGSLFCMIHRSVMERHGGLLLLPRTVFLLKSVTVFRTTSGKMSATVTLNNLVSIYFKKNSGGVGIERFAVLKKDEVRRNAARLNRDERARLRILEESLDQPPTLPPAHVPDHAPAHAPDHAPAQNSQFNPGNCSSPLSSNNLGISSLVANRREPSTSTQKLQTPISTRLGNTTSTSEHLPSMALINSGSSSSSSVLSSIPQFNQNDGINISRNSFSSNSLSSFSGSSSSLSSQFNDGLVPTSSPESNSSEPTLQQGANADTSHRANYTNPPESIRMNTSGSTNSIASSLAKFQAPVPSPPSSGKILSTNPNVCNRVGFVSNQVQPSQMQPSIANQRPVYVNQTQTIPAHKGPTNRPLSSSNATQQIATVSRANDSNHLVQPRVAPLSSNATTQQIVTVSRANGSNHSVQPRVATSCSNATQQIATVSRANDSNHSVQPRVEPSSSYATQQIATVSRANDSNHSVRPRVAPSSSYVTQQIPTVSQANDSNHSVQPRVEPSSSNATQQIATVSRANDSNHSVQPRVAPSSASKFVFRPRFVPPVKFSQSQASTQNSSYKPEKKEELVNLFEGLDEDSLFGDF